MTRAEVKSSWVESIGYEGDTLEVAFKDGKTFRYAGVPADLYESVMGAESVGKALRQHILKGGFEVEEVTPEEE